MEKSEITKITDLIKTDFDLAVEKTESLSDKDREIVLLYVVDNLYDYKEDHEYDEIVNKDAMKFCRSFKPSCKSLLKEIKKGENGKYYNLKSW